jgi:hypothetical protein
MTKAGPLDADLLELLNSAEEIEELLRQFARHSKSGTPNRFAEMIVSAMQKSAR